jgi:hypothetical protein
MAMGVDSLKTGVEQAVRLSNCVAVDVSEDDYERAEGFSIYVPSTASGDIVATPLGGDTDITFSDYTAGAFLRSGAIFKKIDTTTAATDLEAWY